MNKNEIIEQLTEAGIDHDPKVTKGELEQLLPGGVTKGQVRVRAVRHLSEGGNHYKPGDEFEITEKRAESLGDLVTKAE